MTDNSVRSFLEKERQKFIHYVRSLVTETAEMEAEDIVHDVLVKLLERTDNDAPLDYLAAYTYRSLRNKVIDRTRVKKPVASLDQTIGEDGASLMDVLADDGPSPLEALTSKQGRARLFEALEELSSIERQVIIAHEFEGTPFKALSKEMGIAQNTLLSHKARGLKKLKAILANELGEKHDG